MAPNRNVVKPKLVPPQIKHRLIEAQDSFLGDARRRRRELLATDRKPGLAVPRRHAPADATV